MWLTPEVRDHLVYWRNPLETGVVFGSVLVLLVSVKYVSLISVVGNLLLALVTSTVVSTHLTWEPFKSQNKENVGIKSVGQSPYMSH